MRKFLTIICFCAFCLIAWAQPEAKVIKKECKKFTKAGWMVAPVVEPMEVQIEKEIRKSKAGYIIAESSKIAKDYTTAKTHAIAEAKKQIQAILHSEISIWAESVLQQQIKNSEITDIEQFTSISKQHIEGNLSRAEVVLECYRIVQNKQTEVLVRVVYDIETTKKAIMHSFK